MLLIADGPTSRAIVIVMTFVWMDFLVLYLRTHPRYSVTIGNSWPIAGLDIIETKSRVWMKRDFFASVTCRVYVYY